jgi:AbrB family looped-hinge helix DNA binding protein
MRITSKGQVTIPQAIRERAGFLPGTEVEFVLGADGVVRLARPRTAGAPLVGAIAALRGQARGHLSTEEIMALTRGEERGEGGA